MRQDSSTIWSTLCVDKHIVYHAQRLLGILNPSTIFAISDNRIVAVMGPNGLVRNQPGAHSILEAVIASGSLIIGNREDCQYVSRLLEGAATSRTTSYLCNVATSCDQIARAHNRIRSARIAILGCGGIGSLVAQLATGFGVRRVVLVDVDHVEESNFNRQLFWTKNDIGLPKVDILKENILARYHDAEVKTVHERITTRNISSVIDGCTAVVCTVDEPIGIEALVASEAAVKRIPLLTAGYLLSEGFVNFPLATIPRLLSSQWIPGPCGIMPSFGPANAELAGRTAGILLQIITGLSNLPPNFCQHFNFNYKA